MPKSEAGDKQNQKPIRKILVVDDEATLRMGISYSLAGENTHVEVAADGHTALDWISREKFDLVILDLRMPNMDGVAVLESMRAAENRLPVILCSAEFSESSCLFAIRHGVVDFMLKPMNPQELRSAAESVLNPMSDTLGSALRTARAGDLSGAVGILAAEQDESPVNDHWLQLLRLGIGSDPKALPDEFAGDATRLVTRLALNAPSLSSKN